MAVGERLGMTSWKLHLAVFDEHDSLIRDDTSFACLFHGIGTHALTYDRDFDVRETHAQALDDLVVLAGIMLGHSRLDGEQQVFHFPCIGVWRKDSGGWRMIAWQSSSGSR